MSNSVWTDMRCKVVITGRGEDKRQAGARAGSFLWTLFKGDKEERV